MNDGISLTLVHALTKIYEKNTCDFNNAIQIRMNRKWPLLNARKILQSKTKNKTNR